jgi:hypothetical protein
MKGYGLPRQDGVEYPDKGDIKNYGLATSDRCSRKDRGKNIARRYWKKRERRLTKEQIKKEKINE